MKGLLYDLRHAARSLSMTPVFTSVALVTLALGIGANAAIFSVVEAALLRALPYHDPDRLVIVWERKETNERNVVNLGNFFDWKTQCASFEGMAAFADFETSLGGAGEPEEIPAQAATGDLFQVLGVEAVLGRTFTPRDAAPGAPDVAVLGNGLWERRFGADPGVVGRTIRLNDVPTVVVGVLPPRFSWHLPGSSLTGKPAEIWVPWTITEAMKARQGRYSSAVARLRPAVPLSRARAEMSVVAARLAVEHRGFNTGWGVTLVPLREQLVGAVRRPLWLFFGAVGFVLLIACANVASLLLARGAARRKELAVRVTLGASRSRIVRHLLAESLLLSAVGGAAGVAIARLGTGALARLGPPELAGLSQVELNGPVLAFTLAAVLLAALLFGAAPAVSASRLDPGDALRETGRTASAGPGAGRLRTILVTSEISLALVLLVGAGLLVRSLGRLASVRTGFDRRNALTFRVSLPRSRYAEASKQLGFFTEALDRLRELPGVEEAGVTSFLPLSGSRAATTFAIAGRPAPPPGLEPVTGVCVTDRSYFQAMRIGLRRGRLFTDDEVREPRHVVLVNEALVRKYFRGEEALGQRLSIAMSAEPIPTEIVGIVADVRHQALSGDPEPMSFWPLAELPYGAMTFVLRTHGDPFAVSAATRAAIRALDPTLPVADVRSLEGLLAASIARERFQALLLTAFSLLALSLAAVGVYGSVAYAVAHRRRELGIRTALGATPRDLLSLVLRQGLRLAAIGACAGLLAALATTRLMRSLLFGITETDPSTFAGTALLLSAVVLLACLVPAWRATKADPMDALRAE